MKTLCTVIATLLMSSNLFAAGAAGSKTIMTCTDQKSRKITISQSIVVPGQKFVATVQDKKGKVLKSVAVTYEHFDVTFPATYKGPGIDISINSVMAAGTPVGITTGSLKLNNEKSASDMNCQKPTEFVCKASVNCMPPVFGPGAQAYCSGEYLKWAKANCDKMPAILE